MINNDELIKGSLDFINRYKRLPCNREDSIEVEKLNDDNEIEIRTYKALKYINELFGGQEKFAKYLLDNEIITYKLIANTLGLTELIIRNAMTKQTKNPQPEVRRGLEIFFNDDLYKELGLYASLCEKCTKRNCKQFYWVEVKCKNYKEKKQNNKNT